MMNNFGARTITGLSMVFILLAALAFSYWIFAFIFLLFTIFGLLEFYRLFSTDNSDPQWVYGTIAGGLLYIAISLHPIVRIPLLWILPLVFIPFVIEIFRKRPFPMNNIGITLTGIGYIALPFGLLNLMNGENVEHMVGFPVMLTGIFVLTWVYDTGAYLYGKQFGKHLFFERISPKKTWEGIIAGAVLTLLTAAGLSVLIPGILLVHWLVIACIIILFGTFGDLAESMFKRSLHIKDSGTILPGHGGILDRFDSLFISVPFVFLYLFLSHLI